MARHRFIAHLHHVGLNYGVLVPPDVVDALGVIFPNQDERGTHVNISGAGVTKHAPNAENAIKFLEYLTSEFAQRLFAEGNNEYPIIGEVSGPIATVVLNPEKKAAETDPADIAA